MQTVITTETLHADDPSWQASRHGHDVPVSITLDISKFVKGTHYPNDFLKSGILLAQNPVSKMYEPYKPVAESEPDGLEIFAGVLLFPQQVRATTGEVIASMLWHGAVYLNKLPIAAGTNGGPKAAGAVAALKSDNPLIRFV